MSKTQKATLVDDNNVLRCPVDNGAGKRLISYTEKNPERAFYKCEKCDKWLNWADDPMVQSVEAAYQASRQSPSSPQASSSQNTLQSLPSTPTKSNKRPFTTDSPPPSYRVDDGTPKRQRLFEPTSSPLASPRNSQTSESKPSPLKLANKADETYTKGEGSSSNNNGSSAEGSLSADSISQQFGTIAGYVRKLERKVLALERSQEYRDKKIESLTQENNRLKADAQGGNTDSRIDDLETEIASLKRRNKILTDAINT